MNYKQHIDRVIEYIGKNLDEEFSLEKLCEIACFSKYHFHRLFTAYTGLSLNNYIKWMRLKRAAHQLIVNREDTIINIALDAGFESHESFSRAFKQVCGQSPSAFRRKANWKRWERPPYSININGIKIMTITNNLFKENWEKTSELQVLPDGLAEKMAATARPGESLIFCELIAEGCSNLNFKIQFEGDSKPLLLRVYLRDKSAARREQKLATLLKHNVPIPDIYYTCELDGYSFAICEFLDGVLLRDLSLTGTSPDQIMREVGETLAKIASHKFAEAGFFDADLNVESQKIPEIIDYARDCLKQDVVKSTLSNNTIQKIELLLDNCAHLLPSDHEPCLVHGDFGPENILVNNVNGVWKVSGVLDWEFSFSGSVLWDVANMLRYSHKLPKGFQESFVKGLGVDLPTNWEQTIAFLNLSALLDCLKRSDIENTPNRCNDICELIDTILPRLTSY